MAKDSLSGKMQQIYLDQQQKWRKDADGGYVEIAFFEKTDELSYDEVTLEKVGLTIERLLQAGHPYSDITILCRANNKGSLLARYLLRHQIPVISSDSLLLNQSEEVIFFIAILKLLANRHDAVAGAEMIHYLLSAGYFKNKPNLQEVLSGLNIFPLPSSQRLDWQKIIGQLLAKEEMAFSFADLTYLNLFDVCETITRHFFTTAEPNPFVAFFMDAVFEYSEKNSLSLADFLQWWDESGKDFSLVVPQGLNAVQIMTIHKSKGLQFPVVIFAFADLGADKATKKGYWVSPDEKLTEGLKAIWLKMSKNSLENTPYSSLYDVEMERSALDMLNLAYVAMTRPKEKLFLLTKAPGANAPSKPKLQHFFAQYLKQNQLWQEEQKDYAFGRFEQTDQEKAPLNPGDPVFRRLLSRSWTGALRMRSNQQEWGLASAGQRERGKLLHRAMEQIITTNDISPVLARMCADGEIDQPTEKEWNQRIRELLSLEALKPCFEPEATVKTEAGLFDEYGNFYRPDRVVMLKEKTVVIDYKTGREYDSHRQQIETYAKLLESMGYPAVEKMLLYLDEYKLKSV
jgi:ATP-dependent exoDNAse (exonuclease V) beta subunit